MASSAPNAAATRRRRRRCRSLSGTDQIAFAQKIIVVPAKAGTHNHRCIEFAQLGRPFDVTTNIGGYGSPRSRGRLVESLAAALGGQDLSFCNHFLTANTHTTPPCGTLFSTPILLPVATASWMRWASTPQPDCTAMYSVPSTA